MFFGKNRELKRVAAESRGLVLDMVESSRSGHLGTALGCADMGAALFGKLLSFDPKHPTWINRDRFVLSAGHASALLYALLYLFDYPLTLEDLRSFRRTGGLTHGHPEYAPERGIECTTGPLGQGVANAVGMAVASKKRAELLNTKEMVLLDHAVVCLCGDGCLQEGVALEACSLAGLWKLDNFILIYDSNDITLDGLKERSSQEDIAKRFEAMGFEVFRTDGHHLQHFIKIFNNARKSRVQKPRLIIAHTTAGRGIPEVEGKSCAHGAEGISFIENARKKLGLPKDRFWVSKATRKFCSDRLAERESNYFQWMKKFQQWQKKYPKLAEKLKNLEEKEADLEWEHFHFSSYEKVATRVASREVLQYIAQQCPSILSGSADLFSSVKNYIDDGGDFSDTCRSGRNFFFGVREHAMGGVMNGIAYDGMFRPVESTFLVFSDYMRGAIRLAALAKLGTIFLFSHDSIAVGEDGPTHQPVETLASLRCVPGLDVVRPADSEEVVGAWRLAMENTHRPTAILLSRQNLPVIKGIEAEKKREGVLRGGYIIRQESVPLTKVVLSTGSEVALVLEAVKSDPSVRVVSLPCMSVFDRQDEQYRKEVIPDHAECFAVEAGVDMPWYRYVRDKTKICSVNDFGFSGPAADVQKAFGLTVENIRSFLK